MYGGANVRGCQPIRIGLALRTHVSGTASRTAQFSGRTRSSCRFDGSLLPSSGSRCHTTESVTLSALPCQPNSKDKGGRGGPVHSGHHVGVPAGLSGSPISTSSPLSSQHHSYPTGLSPRLNAANSASAGLSSLAAASAAITSQSIRAVTTTTTTAIDPILLHNRFIDNVSHIQGYYNNNNNNIKRLLGIGRLRPFC